MAKYNYTMIDNKYLTPPSLINGGLRLLAQLRNSASLEKFDLDVCCSNENVPAKSYFTFPEHDGLKEAWKEYNWCNPPFNECEKWVKKAYTEQQKGNTTVMLIPVRSETKYFHDYILYNRDVEIQWLRKGFKFLNAETKEEMGIFKNALCYVIFKGIRQDKPELIKGIKQRLSLCTKDDALDKVLSVLSVDECEEILEHLPLKDFTDICLEEALSL